MVPKQHPSKSNRVEALKTKLKDLFFSSRSTLNGVIAALLVTGTLLYFVVKGPELHGQWLRSTVGGKTYMIKGRPNGGGGTGFALKAKSGHTYIVTNSHVCEGALTQSEDKESLLVVRPDGVSTRRRVIEDADFTDLCILEGLPGVEGLEMGDAPSLGEIIAVVGHPALRPLSISRGEVVGKTNVDIFSYLLPTGDAKLDDFIKLLGIEVKDGKCDLPKNLLKEDKVSILFIEMPVKICYNITNDAYMSTVVIHPGNSGSPVIDFFGRVVGVAFASDKTNWAYIVSLKDLKRLMDRY